MPARRVLGPGPGHRPGSGGGEWLPCPSTRGTGDWEPKSRGLRGPGSAKGRAGDQEAEVPHGETPAGRAAHVDAPMTGRPGTSMPGGAGSRSALSTRGALSVAFEEPAPTEEKIKSRMSSDSMCCQAITNGWRGRGAGGDGEAPQKAEKREGGGEGARTLLAISPRAGSRFGHGT